MRPSTARAMAYQIEQTSRDCADGERVKVILGGDSFFSVSRSTAIEVAGDLRRHADYFPKEVAS